MSIRQGLPKILDRKKTGITDIIVFILKYCLLLDTTELFVNEKMELNSEITEKDCNKGFDLIDFFTLDLVDGNMLYSGGSSVSEREIKQQEQDTKQEQAVESEEKLEENAQKEFQGEEQEKEQIQEKIEAEVQSGTSNNNKNSKNDEESKKKDGLGNMIKELINDTISSIMSFLSNKIKAVIMLFIYASVYPAIPFFAVMASMLATLKYLFYKVRHF